MLTGAMSASMPPFVSVVTPVHNGAERLEAVLAALFRQTYPRERYEVVVIDNRSSEDVEAVARRYPVRFLSQHRVPGAYATRNVGIAAARGEVLAFTDADCRPDPEWLSAGIDALTGANASLAGGRVVFTFPGGGTAAELYDAVSFLQIEEAVARGVAFMANLFVRRDVFERLGPLPDHLASNGDAWFTGRATRSGFALVYAADAVVEHPARSLGELLRKCYRVGRGKAVTRRSVGDRPGEGPLRRRPHLRNLSPLILRRRLQSQEPSVSDGAVCRVWGVAWLALAAVGAGFAAGHLQRVRPLQRRGETAAALLSRE